MHQWSGQEDQIHVFSQVWLKKEKHGEIGDTCEMTQ